MRYDVTLDRTNNQLRSRMAGQRRGIARAQSANVAAMANIVAAIGLITGLLLVWAAIVVT
jgi:hypothetical protein